MMLFLSMLMVVISVVFACNPPDCDRPDLGTCVEACCKVGWNVTGIDASTFSTNLGMMLKEGGPDNLYLYWGTQPNQGPLTFVVQGIRSIPESLHVKEWVSIFRGILSDVHR